MARIIWSPRAASDLKEICEYISQDSEHYSKLFAQKVFAIIEDIPIFPKSGRMVPEFQIENLREKIFQNYRIVYRIKNNDIELVTIVQGARLLTDI